MPALSWAVLKRQEREEIKTFLGVLGKCPEVAENKLEAYAIVTAMGPTYLWFQWKELCDLAESFGMSSSEAKTGVAEMVFGAVNTLLGSGMTPDEVMDLVPVMPLGEEEQIIRAMYKSKLGLLYEKLRG